MIDLAYICSPSRSGSTLLDQLIGVHPCSLPAGEIARLTKNIALNTVCSCGSPVSECEFWVPTIDRLGANRGVDLWRDPYALDLGLIRAISEVDHDRQTRTYLLRRKVYMTWLELLNSISVDTSRSLMATHYQHWIRENLSVYDALRERSGRRVVVDSSKSFRIAAGLYRERPKSTRIILLSRDGRGVISSYLRSGRSLRSSVKSWKSYYDRWMRWMENGVKLDHILHVRYEELVGDPASAMRRIFDFLDLPEIQDFDDGQRSGSHILAGNRSTLHSSRIKSDERWKTELTRSQLDYFWRVAGGMMERLGYSGARPAAGRPGLAGTYRE